MDINKLKQLLNANGIDSTKYDNNTLQTLISQAKTLLNIPELENKVHDEYNDKFNGKMYVTRYSPINVTGVTIMNGDTPVSPRKISSAGVIYFETYLHGELEVIYTTGIPDTELDDCLNLIVLYMIQEQESNPTTGGIVNSINEGDVSISYNSGAYNERITSYITDLKNRYASAQVFYL